MQVTSESVKEYLGLVQEYKYIAIECIGKIEEIKTRVKKTTAQLTGMPGGGSDMDSKMVNYVASLDHAEKESVRWSEASNNIMKRIRYFIFDMPITDMEKTILYRKYICLDTWDMVGAYINKKSAMSRTSLFNAHKSALEKIANYVNTSGKYKEEIEGNVYGQNRDLIESIRDSEWKP